jgi:DME family drug/metabolite transporter/O-acetylserine/cysteine efflux transporter
LLVVLGRRAADLVITGLPHPTLTAILAVLHVGAGCSADAYALWGYGLSRLPARQVALLGNLELVCGIVVATALAGETFTPLHLAGAAFVLVGV